MNTRVQDIAPASREARPPSRTPARHPGHWAIGAAALIAGLALPLGLDRHTVDLLVFAAIQAIAGLGVGLLLGQCGIVNLAQSLFYGLGAYASALATTRWGLPAPAGMGLGIALSAALALLVGWPVLRLSGFFLALATLALGMIGSVLFFEWDDLTGGTLGLGGVPRLSLAGWTLDTPQRYYWFVWPLALLLMGLAHNLVHSRIGLALQAMRDAPSAARVLAIDIHRLQLTTFVLSACLGSLAGSLFAHYMTFVSVQSFSVERSILFLLIPVIAGARSVWGVALGALFVSFVPEWLSGLGDAHQVLFGLVLVVVVTLLPGGLAGVLARLFGGKPS
jgi:branched-chain amino acid transport system permease protein